MSPRVPSELLHAVVVVIVVVAATVLRYAGQLDNNSVSIVYGAAVGYAAGATIPRGAERP